MTLPAQLLSLLQCPECHSQELLHAASRIPTLVCHDCKTSYPIVDGIVDLVPPDEVHEPGNYRTETLKNIIAGVYDPLAPFMSMSLLQCSPLRYIDHENRALGRANGGGVYLKAPIGTGAVLGRVLASYHDSTIVCVDRSMKLLRRARSALKAQHPRHQFAFLRADLARLPIRSGSIDSLQSSNGIHTVPDRQATLQEFKRCLKPDGFFSGTALVRDQGKITDAVLDRFERYGVYPMLRTVEFLHQDLKRADIGQIQFETHGAVMFFGCQRDDLTPSK